MEKIVWDERLSMGVDAIDQAHAKLFRIMQKLFDISKTADFNQHTYKEGIKYLEAYSMTHFVEEEAYMRSIQYNGYGRHKKIHDNFRDKTLISLKRDMELSGYSGVSIQRFLNTMSNWLTEHIMREDQAIVGRIVPKRAHDPASLLSIVSRGVNKAVMDVFQTEAKLVNKEYKGQNIGDSFYCRQFYDIEGGARIQFLLGVEELLFMRGIERIPGMQISKKNEEMDEAALSVFEKFFGDISKLFRVETEYEMGKDKLLNREGFRTEFMKGYPCSLLFGTKSGSLIFCYRSWRIKK